MTSPDPEAAPKGDVDPEVKGPDTFDPKSLSPEAQEYLRRTVQSESDSKAGLAEKRLRDEVATRARSATEAAEQDELNKLAEAGDLEGLGARVAARLSRRSVEERAITDASNEIERQMSAAFSESLGPEQVETIRQKVVTDGGAHAEFAKALAEAHSGKTRTEEIQHEVEAGLIKAGVLKRDETPGADKVTGTGQGPPPSGFDETEQAFVDGKIPLKVYEAAKKARDEGK